MAASTAPRPPRSVLRRAHAGVPEGRIGTRGVWMRRRRHWKAQGGARGMRMPTPGPSTNASTSTSTYDNTNTNTYDNGNTNTKADMNPRVPRLRGRRACVPGPPCLEPGCIMHPLDVYAGACRMTDVCAGEQDTGDQGPAWL
ncbi:hypothetical protein POSPLADRAFT_1061775 [Postia placenta MAD-698-R-SB12]|uniref:Uncharacterized protein n=1 Tax=Postia placenta MAD-698-R-SB12 TaxID=670580 RepID=A0A1X6ML81_9APHY|nr:hypothetical protein POSPLADRAFT_1061775 [Postia placenta MAD-698-R-SB12]OSX57068.1 hypothetical protein POSPLADRAFT_1061775 [Postia placenta MAD-698-R-SB12]